MSKEFITFGGGAACIAAGKRLLEQANSLNLFSKTTLYTDADLRADTEFWTKHSQFIEKNKRGYGYWIWKPYLIKKTMEKMKDGDMLLYLDAGCEIDINEKEYLINCFDISKTDYIVGTFTCIERDWNKMDLLLKLNMNDPKYLDTSQRQASAALYFICDKIRSLVNEWYEIACDYHMIDDSPSIAPNLPCFKEHRHDQSIFSLLTKKYNLYSNDSLAGKCIKIFRNKSGISRLPKIPTSPC
jgi:hypothetical protein